MGAARRLSVRDLRGSKLLANRTRGTAVMAAGVADCIWTVEGIAWLLRQRQDLRRWADWLRQPYTRLMLPTTAGRRPSRTEFPRSSRDATWRSLRHTDLTPFTSNSPFTDWDLSPFAPPRPPHKVAQETFDNLVRLKSSGAISGPDADRALRVAGAALVGALLIMMVEDALKRGAAR